MFCFSMRLILFTSFQIRIMAKGKHGANPGQNLNKVLHPNSRKLKKVHKSSLKRSEDRNLSVTSPSD